MKLVIERVLYVTLLITFLGMGYLAFQAAQTNLRLAQLIEQRNEDSKRNQQQISDQLKEMQRQHDKQDEQLRCIVKLFIASGNSQMPVALSDLDNCDIETATSVNPSKVSPAVPRTTSPTSTPPQTTFTQSSASGNEQPNALEQITKAIQDALGKVGL